MKIAVIGEGPVSEYYALALSGAGHNVYFAPVSNCKGTLNNPLQLKGSITHATIEKAAQKADFIIVACPTSHIREIAYSLGDIRRKVLIDATGNYSLNSQLNVNSYAVLSTITGCNHLVKILKTSSYIHLLSSLLAGERIEMIMAGESRKAKEIIKIIAKEMGITRFCDFGPVAAVPVLDEFIRTLGALTWGNPMYNEFKLA